jgi:hypothetical protein
VEPTNVMLEKKAIKYIFTAAENIEKFKALTRDDDDEKFMYYIRLHM